MSLDDSFICPVCGADVPAKTLACPECGADENTGWSDKTIYDGTGIVDPDEDGFDYEDWRRREVEGKRSGRQWLIGIVALLVVVVLVWLTLAGLW